MSRAERLLDILQCMRGRHFPITAKEISVIMNVSERTIYRDIISLQSAGAHIDGEAGVGYILRKETFLPPLMLTEEEAESLLLGLRYVNQRGDATLKSVALTARRKLVSILPESIRLCDFSPEMLPGPSEKDFPVNSISLDFFRNAIRNQIRLSISYGDEKNDMTERMIWPIALSFTDHVRILIAWCELRSDFRFFRTDRIILARNSDRYPTSRIILIKKFREQYEF